MCAHDLRTYDRYLEMAYWTMDSMGQALPDAVASTVRWRESTRPHLLTDQQVIPAPKHSRAASSCMRNTIA